jgi:hypothetical protein
MSRENGGASRALLPLEAEEQKSTMQKVVGSPSAVAR